MIKQKNTIWLSFCKALFILQCIFISQVNGQEGNSLEEGYKNVLRQGVNKADSQLLRDVLLELEKEHEIQFAINDDIVEKKYVPTDRKIKQGSSIESVLKKILDPVDLTYKVVNGYYIILPKAKGENENSFNNQPINEFLDEGDLVVPSGSDRNIQQHVVTGKVSSAKEGFSLPGVSVSVKGGSEKTLTDVNGKYTIQASSLKDTLVFSYIGYNTQDVPMDGLTQVNVRLEEDVHLLREVLITVPYGKQTRESYTGSAVTVEPKSIENRPRESFQNSLQGNVAGLQVMASTGQPGASPTVRIRGISSFAASNAPLYVVDGVPVLSQSVSGLATSSNSMAGINPNDIESVTVLKDASAASIYGSQGANGVIMITTKSGSSGKTKVDASAQYGVNQMSVSERSRPLNTAEMSELLIEGVLNRPSLGITNRDDAYQYLINQGLEPDVNTDWFDVITQVGNYAQYNVSASGGDEKTSFYASAGYYTRDATTKGQYFDRKNVRLSIDHQATDRLSFSGRLSVSRQDLSTVPSAGSGQNPIRTLYRLVPWLTPYTESGEYNPRVTYNPELLLNENIYETKISQLIGNFSAEYKLTDNISLESRAANDFNYSDDYRFWSPLWVDGAGVNGRGAEYGRTWDNWSITNLAKYSDQWEDLSLHVTLGQEASKRNLKSVSTQADNFAAEGLYTLANASTPFVAWSSKSSATLISYFLNTNFSYQQKYFLNLTGRRDGSSRFGRNVRYGNFWSVGLAWNMDKEPFIQEVEFIDQLKVRASYGLSGNQLGDYYGHLGFYSTASGRYGGQPGLTLGQMESGDLRWEKNLPLDVGLEFAVLDNRLTGSVDWYTRKTTDLIMAMPISYTNGIGSVLSNVGEMRNSGIEVSINSDNIRPVYEGGFSWNTEFNISTQKNTVLKMINDSEVSGNFIREKGGDFYQFYMRGYAGVEPTTGEALWFTDGNRDATTTDYSEAAPFKQPNKSALAKFYGGLTNTFRYKGFDLSALIYFNIGNHIYDVWGTYTHNDGSVGLNAYGLISRMYYENRWKEPGDRADYPKMEYLGSQSGLSNQASSRFLYNGSYIRLRDVKLGYDLPVDRMGLKVSSASLYLQANNLYTWVYDDLLPYDPEVGISGELSQSLPISKQFIFGINVTF